MSQRKTLTIFCWRIFMMTALFTKTGEQQLPSSNNIDSPSQNSSTTLVNGTLPAASVGTTLTSSANAIGPMNDSNSQAASPIVGAVASTVTSTKVATNSATTTTTSTSPIDTKVNQLMTSSSSNKNLTGIVATKNASQVIQLRMGFLMANGSSDLRFYYGFGQSAPAVQIAFKRAARDHLVDNFNFTFTWFTCDCDQNLGAGGANQLIIQNQSDVIIGPPCSTPALYAGANAAFMNIPIVIWGAGATTALSAQNNYPTAIQVTAFHYQTALAVRAFLLQYQWAEVSLLYCPDPPLGMCNEQNFVSDFRNVITDVNITITFSRLMDATEASMKSAIQAAQKYSRIVIACIGSTVGKRNFLVWVDDLGLNTEEWVYIMPKIRGNGMTSNSKVNQSYVDMWQNVNSFTDDGYNAKALATTRRLFVVDVQQQNMTAADAFNKELLSLQGSYPFYCNGSCLGPETSDQFTSIFAWTLHNAVYAYLKILNKTVSQYSKDGIRNGSLLVKNAPGIYDGVTGAITIDSNGNLNPAYSIWGYNTQDEPTVFLTVAITSSVVGQGQYTLYFNYTDDRTGIWATRNGVQPLYKPICGYTGDQCPQSYAVYVAGGAGVIFVFLSIALFAIGYAIREKRKESERLNRESFVPWIELKKVHGDRKNDKLTKSSYSLSSTVSGSTISTNAQLIRANIKLENDTHCFFIRELMNGADNAYDHITLFAQKYPVRVKFNEPDLKHLRQLRLLDNDNLNKFIGVCVDGPLYFALWKCCMRGSVKDAITLKNKYVDDPYIMMALIRDLINGLMAIHSSFIGAHGALSSETCLISDRWELKLSEFGMDLFRVHQPPIKRKLLWTAPEILRSGDLRATKSGDMYSFAIICSEFINNELAWNEPRDDKEIEDIIRNLQNSSRTLPFRPRLTIRDEISQNLYQIVRECWTEQADQRPGVGNVRTAIRQCLRDGNQSLMDYVLNLMEQYASSLEQEVEERTRELVDEKKKSDILLFRMLPKQVVEKLKSGESVEPEQFQAATVFFSDIVQFTVLASKCTPLQVVNILNSLYTSLDNIIENFDVYKVETIGDGYLVVSGLPNRNGDRHVEEIAKLSFAFMNAVAMFRIDHLPKERVNLRIGFHTGSVVAGVVGLAMPRYCLFGDTVNTASRMESSGKPGYIHISATSHFYLTKLGHYRTESRGEIIIKGKGVMETFWLFSTVDGHQMGGDVYASGGRKNSLQLEEKADKSVETPKILLNDIGDEKNKPIYKIYSESNGKKYDNTDSD